MQRSEVRALLELLQHLVSQDNRLVELLATMHHTVTYGVDLVETLDDTNLRICQQREDELHTLSMLRDVVHNLLLLTKAPSKPTRSAPPLVITLLSSMLYRAYLIDDEPQFKTRIFI